MLIVTILWLKNRQKYIGTSSLNFRQVLFNCILGVFGCCIISFLMIMLLFWVSFSYPLLNPFILFNSYFNSFNFFSVLCISYCTCFLPCMTDKPSSNFVFLHDFSFFYLLPDFHQLIFYFFSLPHHFFSEILLWFFVHGFTSKKQSDHKVFGPCWNMYS